MNKAIYKFILNELLNVTYKVHLSCVCCVLFSHCDSNSAYK